MGETRTRSRIRRAVESRGYEVAELTYERPYYGGEFEGTCGGWWLWLDRDHTPNAHPGNDLMAVTADELLAYIDYQLKPTEPCECPTRSHHPLIRLKGDPQGTLHEPGCRWHIAYRLYWWADREETDRG